MFKAKFMNSTFIILIFASLSVLFILGSCGLFGSNGVEEKEDKALSRAFTICGTGTIGNLLEGKGGVKFGGLSLSLDAYVDGRLQQQVRAAIFANPKLSNATVERLYDKFQICMDKRLISVLSPDEVRLKYPDPEKSFIKRSAANTKFGEPSIVSWDPTKVFRYDTEVNYHFVYSNNGPLDVTCLVQVYNIMIKTPRGERLSVPVRNISDEHKISLDKGKTKDISGDIYFKEKYSAGTIMIAKDELRCWYSN